MAMHTYPPVQDYKIYAGKQFHADMDSALKAYATENLVVEWNCKGFLGYRK